MIPPRLTSGCVLTEGHSTPHACSLHRFGCDCFNGINAMENRMPNTNPAPTPPPATVDDLRDRIATLTRERDDARASLEWADPGADMTLTERADAACTLYYEAERSRQVMQRALHQAREERDAALTAVAAIRALLTREPA